MRHDRGRQITGGKNQAEVKASPGSENIGLFIGLTNCAPGGWAEVYSIKTLPGAGVSWRPGHPPPTFANNLSATVIAHRNSSSRLDVMVHDDTTAAYMILRLWTRPPPIAPQRSYRLVHFPMRGRTTRVAGGIAINQSPASVVLPRPAQAVRQQHPAFLRTWHF